MIDCAEFVHLFITEARSQLHSDKHGWLLGAVDVALASTQRLSSVKSG